jgi:hypothetical protein
MFLLWVSKGQGEYTSVKVKVKVKVKCAVAQALRLCTGRTAHRGGVEV